MKILITDGIEKNGAEILLKAGFELTQKTLTPEELLKRNGEIPRDREVILYCT